TARRTFHTAMPLTDQASYRRPAAILPTIPNANIVDKQNAMVFESIPAAARSIGVCWKIAASAAAAMNRAAAIVQNAGVRHSGPRLRPVSAGAVRVTTQARSRAVYVP